MACASFWTVIIESSTSSGNNWSPVGLIGLPETPRTRPERRFGWRGCVTLIESEFGRTPFKPSRGTDSLEGAFHEAEVRQANRRPGEETLRRSLQRWLRLPHVSRAGCPRSSPSREERRDCERERLDRIFEAGQQPSRTHTAFPSDLWQRRLPTDGAFRFVVGTPVDRAAVEVDRVGFEPTASALRRRRSSADLSAQPDDDKSRRTK